MKPLDSIPVTDRRVASCAQAILAVEDMTPFGAQDPVLSFEAGNPLRYYLMRLRRRPAVVGAMTRHQRATQCLASADAQPWWIVVAPPERSAADLTSQDLLLIRMEPGQGLKLHRGTWHAGPFFEQASALFFNLELADTNINDHGLQSLSVQVPLQLR